MFLTDVSLPLSHCLSLSHHFSLSLSLSLSLSGMYTYNFLKKERKKAERLLLDSLRGPGSKYSAHKPQVKSDLLNQVSCTRPLILNGP